MPNAQETAAARRTIYRGKEPQRKPLAYLAAGLVGVCLIGLLMRGPEPVILAALVLSPIGVFAYYLFAVWARQRIRRVDLDQGDLVLRTGFGRRRRVPLAQLTQWRLQDIALYTAGITHDPDQAGAIDTGAAVTGPALTARETGTGTRIELVVDDAEIDTRLFRTFAPDAIAQLEQRAARKGKAHVRFSTMPGGG